MPCFGYSTNPYWTPLATAFPNRIMRASNCIVTSIFRWDKISICAQSFQMQDINNASKVAKRSNLCTREKPWVGSYSVGDIPLPVPLPLYLDRNNRVLVLSSLQFHTYLFLCAFYAPFLLTWTCVFAFVYAPCLCLYAFSMNPYLGAVFELR